MSVDINNIKRKLLVKYPTFGSVIANLEFQESNNIQTAGTNGKIVYYNPEFLSKLSNKEQIFVFAHEICHVALDHIKRSEGKDKRLWNIATDSVINALLKQDGLPIINGGVDIKDAEKYDAEEMYNKLLEEKNKQEENKEQKGKKDNKENNKENDKQDNKENNKENDKQDDNEDNKENDNQDDNENSKENDIQDDKENKQKDDTNEEQENDGNNNENENQKDVGHDTHGLWEKAIEEMKKEQEESKQEKNEEKEKNEEFDFAEKGEKETFKQNRIERKKQLQELSKELAKQTAQEAGTRTSNIERRVNDIGISTPLIDWRRYLKQAIKYDEEWTRKNAKMREGYFRHKVQEVPISETEILLDTSGSVSEVLLKNFLRECKNIVLNSKVKVGCFNTQFYGFKELRRVEDIDNMKFQIGGGTNFDVAVEAFSRRPANRIIFTDGRGKMPKKDVRGVIWVVFGNEKIQPKGGKVIQITGKQLEKLYCLDRNKRNRKDSNIKSDDMSR